MTSDDVRLVENAIRATIDALDGTGENIPPVSSIVLRDYGDRVEGWITVSRVMRSGHREEKKYDERNDISILKS